MNIIGYAYEADLHCMVCAERRFGDTIIFTAIGNVIPTPTGVLVPVAYRVAIGPVQSLFYQFDTEGNLLW